MMIMHDKVNDLDHENDDCEEHINDENQIPDYPIGKGNRIYEGN